MVVRVVVRVGKEGGEEEEEEGGQAKMETLRAVVGVVLVLRELEAESWRRALWRGAPV